MRNSFVKNLVAQARERMVSGGYENKNQIQSNIRKSFRIYDGGLKGVEYKVMKLTDSEDEKLYNKVKHILTKDADLINPISRLMDKEFLKDCDDIQRQRYVFSLAAKYEQMRERFYREQGTDQLDA